MIWIGNVNCVSSVVKGEKFKIGISTVYFTFPFRTIYVKVEKDDGTTIFKWHKKIWFFFGIWHTECYDRIYVPREYRISVGYVK